MKQYTRREIAKLALMSIPAATLLSSLGSTRSRAAVPESSRPNSKVAGVQLGLNVPYSFHQMDLSAPEILNACVSLGVSSVELRLQPVELFMGAPATLIFPGKAMNAAKAEQETLAPDRSAQLRQWRRSAPLKSAADFRRLYETAGVLIEILKVDGIFDLADEELDYCFAIAKALGVRAISCEISFKEDDLRRLGRFADKHELWVAYHGHTTVTPAHWEKAFSFARFNAANVDLGHFIAGNNYSPIDFIKKHHDRITHVHLKDRKLHNGPDTPFGEGDTPIIEVLRLIRDNRWEIRGIIEFEYTVPAGSTLMAEIGRSIGYCRTALAG